MSSETLIQELKKEIEQKGILPKEDIQASHPNLKQKEINSIVKELVRDPSIHDEGEVLRYTPLHSSVETDFLTEMEKIFTQSSTPDSIKVDQRIYRGFFIVANPSSIDNTLFFKIFSARPNVHASMIITPESHMNVIHHIQHELAIVEKELQQLALEGKVSGKLIKTLEDKKNFLKDRMSKILSNELAPFRLMLTFVVEENNDEDLNFAANTLMATFRKLGFIVKTAINYQKEVLQSTMPNGASYLNRREIITMNNVLSKNFPFVRW